MPIRRTAAVPALLALATLLGGAPALAQTASGGEEAAPAVSPYARGAVPAYTPPTPITRPGAAGPAANAAPVGVVSIEGETDGDSAAGRRPVVPADPVYSDPDLAPLRNDPYSLSRHTATQAGGLVTPYAPPAED